MKQVIQLTLLLNYLLPGIYTLQHEPIYERPDEESDNSATLQTDAGYGSRVQASLDVARATLLARLLYGTDGPGRRKRPIDTWETILKHATDVSFSGNGDLGKHSAKIGAL